MTDREQLAAEHALRLLEGEELLEALRLMGSDPAFAAEVARWEERLAPLFEEIGGAEPGPEMWPRIRQAIAAQSDSARVVALQRRVRGWRWGTAAAGAMAAALALFVVVDQLREPTPLPPPSAPAPQPGPVLVASVTVLGAVVVAAVGGSWGASLLNSVRGFMVANSVAIAVGILLILGAKVLGDGLSGLGR